MSIMQYLNLIYNFIYILYNEVLSNVVLLSFQTAPPAVASLVSCPTSFRFLFLYFYQEGGIILVWHKKIFIIFCHTSHK